jgi:adenine phosphoribosyltransferase
MPGDLAERIRAHVREIPDFPQPGINFKDITPVLAEPALFAAVIDALAEPFRNESITRIVAIESRGFIFGAPVAIELSCGFVPIRKPGKLPHQTHRIEYELEYGTDILEAHVDAITPDDRVLIIDDLLATGGTARAAAELVRLLGAEPVGAAFVLELGFLAGRERLGEVPVNSLLRY